MTYRFPSLNIIIILMQLKYAATIECICTEENKCEVLGTCQGTTCLIGLLRNNQVIRTCGDQAVGCYRDIDRWSEVCACDELRCNSFRYYRSNMPKDIEIDTGDVVFDRRSVGGTMEPSIDLSDQSSTQPSLLTVLIVAVPLAVAATMVVVVAFNYYCHLC